MNSVKLIDRHTTHKDDNHSHSIYVSNLLFYEFYTEAVGETSQRIALLLCKQSLRKKLLSI